MKNGKDLKASPLCWQSQGKLAPNALWDKCIMAQPHEKEPALTF